jgi:hypothetical protein
MSRKAEFVADVQRANRQIWDGIKQLKALQPECTYMDYGTTLGTQNGVDPADVIAVLFTTTNALEGLLDAGHGTNMAKLL